MMCYIDDIMHMVQIGNITYILVSRSLRSHFLTSLLSFSYVYHLFESYMLHIDDDTPNDLIASME
jgi:hypothetical protein